MKRRQFLGSTIAGAVAMSHSRSLFALDADNEYRKQIGIQLYTLREQISDDVKATMKVVADAGYKQVEPYGFPNATPMIEAAKDLGLAINSTHFAQDSVVDPDKKGVTPFAKVLDQANAVGLTHLVIPYLGDQYRKTLDDYRRVSEQCNQAAEQAKKAGIQLSYHNHAFELKPMEGGKTGYDVMMEEFSPDMKFEVDVFWIQVGGKDPIDLVRKLKGRVSQLHLKDLNPSLSTPNYGSIPKDAFEELGDGVISIEPIIEVASEAGVAHCHVEQDHSPHPLQSIQESMEHLRSL